MRPDIGADGQSAAAFARITPQVIDRRGEPAAGKAKAVPDRALLDQPLHSWRNAIPFPGRNKNRSHLDKTNPEALNSAKADRVFVEPSRNAKAIAKRQSAPGKGVVGRRWRESYRQAKQIQSHTMGELRRQPPHDRPPMTIAEHEVGL